MLNSRTLFPALFKSAGGGGGGSGQTIQVPELPEAVLSEKNKIYQYIGSTTETLTNGYFYKCIETTGYDWEETEASETFTEVEEIPTASAETIGTIYKLDDKYYHTVIVLSYSWDNIDVMKVESGGGVAYATTPHIVGTYLGSDLWEQTILAPALGNWVAVTDNPDNSNVVNLFGLANTEGGDVYAVGTSVRYSKDYGIYMFGQINNTNIVSVKHVTIQYIK